MIATKVLKDEEVSIEAFQLADLDVMMEIENLSFTVPWSRKSYEELWPLDSIDIWVAKLGGELVGYYLIQTVGQEQELHTFAVKPECRRMGIGRKLMNHMLEGARKRCMAQIFLQVRPSNLGAKGLYKSLGFIGVGLRRKYYRDDFEDALVMSLKLG